jgi:uncharacterized membrane protein (DUF2068 family)
MEKLTTYLPVITAVVGAWALINGILHDIFVIIPAKKYDRDLLRLLMDGHILITCGIIQLISYKGLQANEAWAYYVAGVATISLLVYCGMIFPFLKSIVTIALNLMVIVLLCISFLNRY